MNKILGSSSKKILVLIFLFTLLIVLKLPTLFEPTWYGDEGIYAAVGDQMNKGGLLYTDTWDNKTPGIYYIYSTVFKLFGTNQFGVRLVALIFAVITFFYFYKIFRLLFGKASNFIIPALVFIFFWATPLFESNIANGENFFVMFSTIGAYYGLKSIYDNKNTLNSILCGLAFGIGFMIKVHPIFDFAAILLAIFIVKSNAKSLRELFKFKNIFRNELLVPVAIFIAPLILYLLFAAIQGNLSDFLHMFFTQGGSYVFEYQNNALGFILFQNNLTTRTIALIIFVAVLSFSYIKDSIPQKTYLITLIFAFSLYAVLFSGRPYVHYLLQLIIPAILFGYIGFSKFKDGFHLQIIKIAMLGFLITFYVFGMFFNGQSINGYSIIPYYVNFVSYAMGNESKFDYNNYFDKNVNKLEALVDGTKDLKGKNVVLLDNNPWFYPLADVYNPTKYVVIYHLGQDKVDFTQWANDLPKIAEYVVENNERLDIIPDVIQNVVKTNYTFYENAGTFTVYQRIQ